MLVVFYMLLMIRAGRCSDNDDQNFVTKSVGAGEDVTLTCARHPYEPVGALFWIRLVAGNSPEILGKTFSFDYDGLNEISRITTKQGPGIFALYITKTKPSDTAFYYCLKSQNDNISFLTGTFLRITEPQPDISAVIQNVLPEAVLPGDSVALQCSVFSGPEQKTCPEQHSVYWFRVTPYESYPSLIYAQSNRGEECENRAETQSLQSCVYSFFKGNISYSDAGTYYCALAACGKVVFGNGTKLDIKVDGTPDQEKDNVVLFLLLAALAISLIVIAFLLCAIGKTSCDCCKASVNRRTNAETVCGNQQSEERNQDSLVYAAAVFTRRKDDKAARRTAAAANEETVYTNVRGFVLD